MPLSEEEKKYLEEMDKQLDAPGKGSICYQYRYIDTDELFEVYQRIHDDAYTEYEGRPCERLISSVAILTDVGKPRTIGSLAEKNMERMVKEGDERIQKTPDRPWWRPNKDKPISLKGKSDKEIQRYIKYGK